MAEHCKGKIKTKPRKVESARSIDLPILTGNSGINGEEAVVILAAWTKRH
jgi:hypothetical protein